MMASVKAVPANALENVARLSISELALPELMSLDDEVRRLGGEASRSKVLRHLRAMRPPGSPQMDFY